MFKSKTYKYIRGLKAEDTVSGNKIKRTNSRDVISKLPSPSNVSRNLELVPAVQIAFTLSTSSALPSETIRKISRSEHQASFTNDSLLGLCTSGRRLPVEVFLHEHRMMEIDQSGGLFEEVAWHEIAHGIEGVNISSDGAVTRETPWSYRLQQAMLEIDEEVNHEPSLPESKGAREYLTYLRKGTSLQDNVSELFARAAVIFMYEVKETRVAPTSIQEFAKIITASEDQAKPSRKKSNISDFLQAWSSFSPQARDLFTQEGDDMIKRVGALYGCEIT